MLRYILLFLQTVVFADHGNYAIALGEEDKDRLMVVNEIYNPFSADFLKISLEDRVLEIGCGIGLVSQEIAKKAKSVLATDVSEEQLAVARSLNGNVSNLEFRQLSAYDLGSLQEKFDVVYARFLLCHLPNPEEVIRQVKGVLKPGGKFIIEDLTGNETLYSIPNTKGMEILRLFDRLQFELQQSDDHYFAKLPALLEQEGFAVVSSNFSHPELDTKRKRSMLTYNLSSLKNALIAAGKINLLEYDAMYPVVEELANTSEVQVYSYELGQITAAVS